MNTACEIPTPEQRRYIAITAAVEADLSRKVDAALQGATDRAQAEIEATGLNFPPPTYESLASVVHQRLFCTLCGADPDTLAGGNAEIALAIVRNSQNIAKQWERTS